MSKSSGRCEGQAERFRIHEAAKVHPSGQRILDEQFLRNLYEGDYLSLSRETRPGEIQRFAKQRSLLPIDSANEDFDATLRVFDRYRRELDDGARLLRISRKLGGICVGAPLHHFIIDAWHIDRHSKHGTLKHPRFIVVWLNMNLS